MVFFEALASEKTVIAGNKDGSAEALLNEKFGILIDPEKIEDSQ